jgi:NAD(P) transhydrogenase subunit alpha
MTTTLALSITVFVLAVLIGYEVISKVPATLHTPLMSATNAIHGIVIIGAGLIAATARGPAGYAIAFVAVAFATANVVGGYAVTARMLRMFQPRAASASVPRPVGEKRP